MLVFLLTGALGIYLSMLLGAITTVGKNATASLIIADAGFPAYNATNAHIGVGDSSTAFSAAHTDLQAATNKFRKVVNAAPGRTNNVIQWVASFASGEANFAWAEWGIFNHASTGTMLCRKVASHGTKASGDVWTFTVDVTVG